MTPQFCLYYSTATSFSDQIKSFVSPKNVREQTNERVYKKKYGQMFLIILLFYGSTESYIPPVRQSAHCSLLAVEPCRTQPGSGRTPIIFSGYSSLPGRQLALPVRVAES